MHPYELLWRVPGLADRLAATLFLTPFGEPDATAPPRARSERVVLPGPQGAVARVHEPVDRGSGDAAPVFLVHGWGGAASQMAGFVDALVERGHRAITIDLPAHGESPGRRTNVLECRDVLLGAARRFGEPRGIIAHSFGGPVAALAVREGLAVGALVFIAPLPSMDHGLRQFALRARVPLDVMDRAARRIEADLGFRRTVMDLVELAQRNQAPLLCLHDVDDRVTPVEASREIVRSWPAARILETRGLGHRRILRDPAVIEHAVAFLAQGHQERPRDLERALAAQCALEA